MGAVVAALAGLAAGWIAACSVGLLAHALRHALTWVALGVAAVAAWPGRVRPVDSRLPIGDPGLQPAIENRESSIGQSFWLRLAALIGGLAVAVVMTASGLMPVHVLAVAWFLAVLAGVHVGLERRILLLASVAVGVLGVWRLALTSIPLLWLGADSLGRAMGFLAGRATGEPLWVGATFGGVDFLVAMAALYAGWLASTAPPRLPRALWAAGAILAGHFAYLAVLSLSAGWHAALSEAASEEPGWSLAGALDTLVPWNLPALGCAIHLAIAAAMLRWAPWPAAGEREPSSAIADRKSRMTLGVAAAALAVALPVVTTLTFGKARLDGQTIVVYEKGFLNWLKPQHGDYGRYSIGMYGMLPTYVGALGARCVLSPDLSEEDLAGASVLILLYPNQPWAAGQLERIWSFVRRGGSLLVFGEHTIRESDGGSRFNDVLAPASMRVRFDSATFEVGGWLQSYEALAHPATAGIPDSRNQFGVVIGASVALRWPARPVLVGRWGWGDPGDPSSGEAMMGNHRYDAGEKLGDIVLAVEQPFGAGRIITFGDTSNMTNGITAGSHVFTSRLLAYAAGGLASSQAAWRGYLGLALAVALVALLGVRAAASRVALAALLAAASLLACTAASHRAAEALPDGRLARAAWRQLARWALCPATGERAAAALPDGSLIALNNLAYMDETHVGANSDEGERPNGTMGLMLTLMRNGFLTLQPPTLTPERLGRAGLLVSVAPSKEFSAAERKAIRQFVEGGGIFVSTVGWDARGPSRRLLADFGLYVGGVRADAGLPDDAPKPLGHFKSPYLKVGENLHYVRFHAGWPVECTDRNAKVIAYGPNGTKVILARPLGKGWAILVGDTCFAMNLNLENMDGTPIEGLRENADFWRWLLADLRGTSWYPSAPGSQPQPPPAEPPEP